MIRFFVLSYFIGQAVLNNYQQTLNIKASATKLMNVPDHYISKTVLV